MSCIDCFHFWACDSSRRGEGCAQFVDEDEIQYIRHASWVTDTVIFRTNPSTVYVHKRCSSCGHKISHTSFDVEEWEAYKKDHWNPETSKYCPKCGALMDADDPYAAYKKYIRDWCHSRGYVIDEVDEETGINGECQACYDEWYTNEWAAKKGE